MVEIRLIYAASLTEHESTSCVFGVYQQWEGTYMVKLLSFVDPAVL